MVAVKTQIIRRIFAVIFYCFRRYPPPEVSRLRVAPTKIMLLTIPHSPYLCITKSGHERSH
jgi:hypothetical protein